jgi:hypothetical protein
MTEAAIGVLCLETAFTKIPGHIRNPATFGFPVIYRVVEGATPERVVSQGDPALLEPVIAAARDLVAQGVAAITTGCGFLVLFQRELAAAVAVPLYTSSLIQLPMVASMLAPDQKVGLLVAKKEALTPAHLTAAGARDVPVCVAGMAGQPEFSEVILGGQRTELDIGRLRAEVLAEAGRLAGENPELGADLVPFAADIQRLVKVPVFDIVTLTSMVYQTLTRRSFDKDGAGNA